MNVLEKTCKECHDGVGAWCEKCVEIKTEEIKKLMYELGRMYNTNKFLESNYFAMKDECEYWKLQHLNKG